MLKHLTIRNYALIRNLEMTPDKGFNVITGETGAGKSIILGALGLLLGNRADTKVLLDESEKCVTEGTFMIGTYQLESLFSELELDYSTETILRREISPLGKSRAFINDTPVNLDVLRKVGYRLMDIHSQHETLELGEQPFQLKFIDAYAGNAESLKQYATLWTQFRDAESFLQKLESEADKLRLEADYTRFQFQELDKLQLEEGDQEILEARVKVGENAELIRTKLQHSLNLLSDGEYSGRKILTEVRSLLNSISSYDASYADLLHRLESLKTELEDLEAEINAKAEDIDVDPEKIIEAQEKLDLLYQLQRKHRATSIKELLNLRQKLSEQVYKTDHLDEEISKASTTVEKLRNQVISKAELLSESRKKVLKKISSEVERLLKELGIPDAHFNIEHECEKPGPSGMDRVAMLFSANKGVAARPIAETASGGEFSRLMFVVKYVMAERTSMPTLILDEIDAGISGDIALKLGQLMRKMSQKHQVISISHLAQIAAMANAHYVVFKESGADRVSSQIKLLEPHLRIEELARIISGNSPSATALKYAKELMEQH
ncbi:MAG: DNA repair protein RecN [Cyclobacteriaceae bacterium]